MAEIPDEVLDAHTGHRISVQGSTSTDGTKYFQLDCENCHKTVYKITIERKPESNRPTTEEKRNG